MKKHLILSLLILNVAGMAQSKRWAEKQAYDWYQQQPWLVGCNYIPANAINELEMWQPETFDPTTIDKELGWAESLGMQTVRVFLHDLLWQQDAIGFKEKIGEFLRIAQRHRIKPLFVLFDSCWDPFPKLGKQREPKPGVHNSGWVQSPGANALKDPTQYPRLEAYVKGVVGAFAKDRRVLGWDVWNEPDNPNTSSYGRLEPPNKADLVEAALPKAFEWARAAGPQQPLTCAVWKGDWSAPEKMTPMERIQVELSDVISFHSYNEPEEFEKRVKWLQHYNRPILCTEYMARGNKSTFHGTMPVAKQYPVAVYNWGFVAGKTQTNLPWDSWQRAYTDREPSIWFHEILYPDGKPYRTEEVEFIRAMTGKPKAPR
jgi:hypothetical protein